MATTAVATTQEARAPSLLAKIAARYSVDPAKFMSTLKATAFKVKDGEVTNEQMMALMIVADQYKLNPFTKEIYAYPDKQNGIVPVVSVDGWTRIVNEHDQFDGVEFEYGPMVPAGTLPGQKFPAHEWVTVKIHRKDRNHPICLTEYLDEVYRPPFTGTGKEGKPYTKEGPWQSHTKRLHRHKTWIQGSRLAFGFAGIYDEDEAQRIMERNITSESTVVERATLKSQVRRASEHVEQQEEQADAPTEPEPEPEPPKAGKEPAEPPVGLPMLMQLVKDATTDEELDYIRSRAKETLKSAGLKAVNDAITNKLAALSEEEV